MPRNAAVFALAMLAIAAQVPVARAQSIASAVSNPARPALHIAQDRVLHPADILRFARVKPGQTVAELLPEGGYYTRLLSLAVGAKGKVFAVVPRLGGDAAAVMASDGSKTKDPSLNAPMTRVERAYVIEDEPSFKNVTVFWQALTQECGNCAADQNHPALGAFSLPEQLDIVFAMNAYHVFKGELSRYAVRGKSFDFDMLELDKAIFRAMKPGGLYVVIDHAAAPGAGFTSEHTLHERSVGRRVGAAERLRLRPSQAVRLGIHPLHLDRGPDLAIAAGIPVGNHEREGL